MRLAQKYYQELLNMGFEPVEREGAKIWLQNQKGQRVKYCAPCMFLTHGEKVYRFGKQADALLEKLK